MDEYLIYPKQFQRASIPVENNRCFVIMPFSEKLDYVYGSIKNELIKANFICNRVDEIGGAIPIINKIITEILKSRYIIADLTDCNPNVFYELGIAHCFKDAKNIIILKQQGTNIPFDITHLTYIEYNPDNIKLLTTQIKKYISENKNYTDFREALNIRGVISYVTNDEELFISYLEKELNQNIAILINILNNERNRYSEKDVTAFLTTYEVIIKKVVLHESEEIINGIMAVYKEIIITIASFPAAEESVRRFIDGALFPTDLNDEKLTIWQTDLSIALAKSNKLLNTVLPWIITYFSKTKTASIDLNRYKLEAFLLTTDNNCVNDVICNAIFDSNCYIREHMADIIGEKRLLDATNNLCRQLICEENYFTAVSIIEALGKLQDSNSVKVICKWLETNDQKIIEEKQFYVLKHIQIALKKLIGQKNSNVLVEFGNKYQKYLQDYFIL